MAITTADMLNGATEGTLHTSGIEVAEVRASHAARGSTRSANYLVVGDRYV